MLHNTEFNNYYQVETMNDLQKIINDMVPVYSDYHNIIKFIKDHKNVDYPANGTIVFYIPNYYKIFWKYVMKEYNNELMRENKNDIIKLKKQMSAITDISGIRFSCDYTILHDKLKLSKNTIEIYDYNIIKNIVPLINEIYYTYLFQIIEYETEEILINVIYVFIKKGFNIAIADRNGNTLLHKIIFKDYFNLIKYLLEYIDPNVQNNYGMTVLHTFAYSLFDSNMNNIKNNDSIKKKCLLLTSKNINSNLIDIHHETVVNLFFKLGYYNMVTILLNKKY